MSERTNISLPDGLNEAFQAAAWRWRRIQIAKGEIDAKRVTMSSICAVAVTDATAALERRIAEAEATARAILEP